MNRTLSHAWRLDVVDADDLTLDAATFGTAREAVDHGPAVELPADCRLALVLVRTITSDSGDVLEIQEAEVEDDGTLPERFDRGFPHAPDDGAFVPAALRLELGRALSANGAPPMAERAREETPEERAEREWMALLTAATVVLSESVDAVPDESMRVVAVLEVLIRRRAEALGLPHESLVPARLRRIAA